MLKLGKVFWIENGFAYTEDNVLISNVFIWAKKPLILQHELEEYCVKNYGRIKESRIGKCGFVIFDDPKDAAKMLEFSHHQYENKHFYVCPSYSWLQPDAEIQRPPMSDDDDATAGGTSIIDLNDDCLLAIFNYLTIMDQIQLTRTSKRFENAFKLKNQCRFKIFDFQKSGTLTLWQLKDLLGFVGDVVESIINTEFLSTNRRVMLKYAAQYCVNLKKIEFQELNAKILSRFIENCKYLREIHLRNDAGTDKFIEKLKNSSSLEILRLDQCFRFTGRHLNKLAQLKELRLRYCSQAKPQYIVNAIRKMKNLHALEIDGYLLNCIAIQQIIDSAPGLEELYVSTDGQGRIDFGNLSKLKEFSVTKFHEFDANSMFFEDLARTHSENLESLCIHGSSTNDRKTANEIIKFQNLKKLTLSFESLNIYILNAIIALKNLEEIYLKAWFEVTDEKLITLLTECHNLQSVSLAGGIRISEEIIKTIVIMLREQRETGLRSHQLKIYENLRGERFSYEAFTTKHDSLELKVLCEREEPADYSDYFDSDDNYDFFDDYMSSEDESDHRDFDYYDDYSPDDI